MCEVDMADLYILLLMLCVFSNQLQANFLDADVSSTTSNSELYTFENAFITKSSTIQKEYDSKKFASLFSEQDNLVPGKPLNLTVLEVTSTTIKISWREPQKKNDAIHGYRVYYVHQNQTLLHLPILKSDSSYGPEYHYTLSNLRPFTDYKLIVAAFTKKYDGEASEVFQKTDISGPSSPPIVNLTCHTSNSLYFRWKRSLTYYNSIDFYKISYRNVIYHEFKELQLNANSSLIETAIVIPNLTMNAVYEVKVRAASISIINLKQIILGSFSEPKRISMHPNCEKNQSQRQSTSNYNITTLTGITFSCFGILLIVLALLLWKKCFRAAYYYLDDTPGLITQSSINWDSPCEVDGEEHTSIPAAEFKSHVLKLHTDGDIGFSKEYEAIQNESATEEYASEVSQHPDNKAKNRYLNIIAYDHSRVHLRQTTVQKKHLDYINANFIDGYQKPSAFIATQGPLSGTIENFWQMIWEQKVMIIVMITNLVERGRRKCDMYWPKDCSETYGIIQVKLITENVMATYTVRTFQIKHLKLKKKKQIQNERTVYQYHYTNWPDHGTPDHPLPVLNFVKKSSSANFQGAGPIVVHCSAGVGRTGTYIVLDAMLKQIDHKGCVNIFGFLRHIRAQRNFLVQTEEQYIFIHDALIEAIESGDTNKNMEEIANTIDNTEFLEAQFKSIIFYQPKEINLSSATNPVNQTKNRSSILPLENSRVHLTPKPGIEGSDYINATWLHGFRRLKDFIVTQHPLAETIKDFWQMVWDHSVQTVILISQCDNILFLPFWPTASDIIETEYYRVKLILEETEDNYLVKHFCMQSILDDYELNIKMFENPQWLNFNSYDSIYAFILKVHERTSDYRNGPIVVIDRYGGSLACQFCCISSLSMQLEYDQTANVYMYAKLYHNKRPGVWTSFQDIKQIYKLLSYKSKNLSLLKFTALRSEFDDNIITTTTSDLFNKIRSNGNINTHLNNQNNSHITNVIHNGGSVIVTINEDDEKELSVIASTTNNLNLDHKCDDNI
uniref:Putative receptor-type tyrosine-protein phosphatase mosPTP-1 n=1 Tax=Corethrella appendiculata TaxID=1370023 RepID=U5EUF9_9DIPT